MNLHQSQLSMFQEILSRSFSDFRAVFPSPKNRIASRTEKAPDYPRLMIMVHEKSLCPFGWVRGIQANRALPVLLFNQQIEFSKTNPVDPFIVTLKIPVFTVGAMVSSLVVSLLPLIRRGIAQLSSLAGRVSALLAFGMRAAPRLLALFARIEFRLRFFYLAYGADLFMYDSVSHCGFSLVENALRSGSREWSITLASRLILPRMETA